jgi:hypothetical protein
VIAVANSRGRVVRGAAGGCAALQCGVIVLAADISREQRLLLRSCCGVETAQILGDCTEQRRRWRWRWWRWWLVEEVAVDGAADSKLAIDVDPGCRTCALTCTDQFDS